VSPERGADVLALKLAYFRDALRLKSPGRPATIHASEN
jgi:hypothetical protein